MPRRNTMSVRVINLGNKVYSLEPSSIDIVAHSHRPLIADSDNEILLNPKQLNKLYCWLGSIPSEQSVVISNRPHVNEVVVTSIDTVRVLEDRSREVRPYMAEVLDT